MNIDMIIDEYLEYTNQYKEKYGNKCIVLMQVGSFFEIYTITDNISENEVFIIADICGIQTSRKNKTISEVSRSNPVMAGFPTHSLSKFTQILLNNNYTIVLVEQVSEPPNPRREVTEVLSPGSNINITTKKSNYMMVIYYEYIGEYLIAGISGIDLSTGKTFVYEVGSTKTDPEFANDEVFRFVSTYNPIEIIIISSKLTPDNKKTILRSLHINNILVHYKWENCEYISSYNNIVNQREILEKAFFIKKGLMSIIEMLNLEKFTIARLAFCCLLQFAHEHNTEIIKELQEPEIFNSNNNMTIEYNSAIQLNILGLYKNDKPLIDVLNKCITSFGSRTFKDKLLIPMINIDELNKSYDDVDKLKKDKIYILVRKHLSNIVDLERSMRKMILNKIAPQDWVSIDESFKSTINIYNTISNFDKDFNVDYINDVIGSYTNILDIDKASKYNLTDRNNIGNIFKTGIFIEIDNLIIDNEKAHNIIKDLCDHVTKIGLNDTTLGKIDYTDRDGYYILITKKRFECAKKIALSKNDKLFEAFKPHGMTTATTYKITHPDIIIQSNIISSNNEKISQLVIEEYRGFVKKFITDNNYKIENIIKYLTRIDIAANSAKNACDFCYTRPIIDSERTLGKSSFIDSKNMRHPLIERIQEDVEYIGNDILLNEDGILLYGINASGKSCFMKAVGVNIIMAQAGMFVAAEKMSYYPYKSVFTRISGMDNIYKGMSSFTVEMTELRNILQRCNKYSLVIGDEICCGTESISGISIVASGIDTLIKKGASFIFASHLHELTKLSTLQEYINCNKLFVKHIRISIDENNNIIYERKLQEGQGSTIYGIEVCKSLDMPYDFMKNAEKFRKEVEGINIDLVKNKKCHYNKKVLINNCKICDKKAEETHHIVYQHKADKDGYLSSYHKNSKHNLVPLCKECHHKEHIGMISIKGYVKTSAGIILKYENI